MTAFILDAVATPRGRGKPNGALAGVHPQALMAQALNALVERRVVAPAEVDDVIVGAVSQVAEQGGNIARQAVLSAGWPIDVSAVSINRFCASGLQAVNFAAMAVGSGHQDLVVAGGVESMSRVPMGSDGAGVEALAQFRMMTIFQVPQGISADLIASVEGISRADVDAYALRSQQRAVAATAEGRFARSLVPVRDPTSGAVLLEDHQNPRASTSLSALAALPPSFVEMGATAVGPHGETFDALALRTQPSLTALTHVHTAGNSSGLADGAAAVAIASEAYVQRHGLKPRARIRALASVGSDPILMLTGPAPSASKALARAGMQVNDIDLWEINEAFAAVVLQTARALELDLDKVNVNGGAIALGHPLGATGAMLLATALDELERTNKTTALITLCIGGGQGVATIVERV